MKKVKRPNPSIDYVRLLAEHSRAKGIEEYSDEVIRAFGGQLETQLSAVVNG